MTKAEEEETKVLNKIMFWVSLSCGIIALFFIWIFSRNQYYDRWQPADTSIIGAYGDIISGVIGSIVGFFSAYLLIRTFRNQAPVNESIVKANNSAIIETQIQSYQTQLQVFDNKFRVFMEAYYKAIDSYEDSTLKGRVAFESIAQKFVTSSFSNSNEFKRRSDSAVEEYLNFYSIHRQFLSVHFRMLYLLTELISESGLEDEDKIMYAKLVRGQLSDSEMYLMRYNCKSYHGLKMQSYCNEFNLLKHCPTIGLLEFRAYYSILKSKLTLQNAEFKKLTSGLDSLFITLKKRIALLFWDGAKTSDKIDNLMRYSIEFKTCNSMSEFVLTITKDKLKERRGGGARIPAAELAFDMFEEKDLKNLFVDFLTECFFGSNFYLYNQNCNPVQIENESDSSEMYRCDLVITSEERLALTQIQQSKRDNHVLEC